MSTGELVWFLTGLAPFVAIGAGVVLGCFMPDRGRALTLALAPPIGIYAAQLAIIGLWAAACIDCTTGDGFGGEMSRRDGFVAFALLLGFWTAACTGAGVLSALLGRGLRAAWRWSAGGPAERTAPD